MVLPLELYYDFKSNNNLEKAKYEYYLVKMYFKKWLFPRKASIGPFKDSRTKELAKKVYSNFELVTNRELESTYVSF